MPFGNEIDELLKKAMEPGEHHRLSEIEQFIDATKAKKGTTGRSAADVYHEYSLWSLDPMGHAQFFKEFRKHFPVETIRVANGSRKNRRAPGYFVDFERPSAKEEADKT